MSSSKASQKKPKLMLINVLMLSSLFHHLQQHIEDLFMRGKLYIYIKLSNVKHTNQVITVEAMSCLSNTGDNSARLQLSLCPPLHRCLFVVLGVQNFLPTHCTDSCRAQIGTSEYFTDRLKLPSQSALVWRSTLNRGLFSRFSC